MLLHAARGKDTLLETLLWSNYNYQGSRTPRHVALLRNHYRRNIIKATTLLKVYFSYTIKRFVSIKERTLKDGRQATVSINTSLPRNPKEWAPELDMSTRLCPWLYQESRTESLSNWNTWLVFPCKPFFLVGVLNN